MTTLLKPFKACIIRGCSSFNQKYKYTLCKGKKNCFEGNAPLVWCAVDAEIGVELMRMVQCKSYYQWGVSCEEKLVWPQTRVNIQTLLINQIWGLSSRVWSIRETNSWYSWYILTADYCSITLTGDSTRETIIFFLFVVDYSFPILCVY